MRRVRSPKWHFYPRPPRGGRPASRTARAGIPSFLPTPSARRATRCAFRGLLRQLISTHALREEGDDNHHIDAVRYATISTHALREEGDDGRCAGGYSYSYFYPRPPRGGRLPGNYVVQATMANNFYPRPPRGGRPF